MTTSQPLCAGIYYANTPTLSNLQQLPLQLDAHGSLRVTALDSVSSAVSISDGTETAHVTTDSELLTTDKSLGAVSGGTAGTLSSLIGGVYNSTPLDLTNTEQAAIQLDANGYLKVKVQALATDYPLTAAANEALFKRSYVLSHEMLLSDKETTYNFIYIKTPPEASKNVFLNTISIGNATSGNHASLTVYKNPTVTSLGVALEPQSLFIEDSQTNSDLLCYNQTTLSNTGTKLMKLVCTNETNIIELNYGLLISPGNAILIRANATSNNQHIIINVFFSEVTI